MSPQKILCHYEVLEVPRDASGSDIKKAHRKLALQLHPDKNNGETLDSFRLVQQAYECLSDPSERKWYDEHREAILQGWSGVGQSNTKMDILFDVVPYQHAACYSGYGDDEGGFYHVYNMVFGLVFDGEREGWTSEGNIEAMPLLFLPNVFGFGNSEWSQVSAFYQAWESFSSCLAFAWTDQYDVKEAPNRRIRRAMDDENKKARRNARRERNETIEALVHFVKRRDPRVKAHRIRMEEERQQKEKLQKEDVARKKEIAREAREEWKRNAELEMAQAVEEDRLAGRIRLADLEDGYDYSGGGKRGKGKNKKGKNVTSEPEQDNNEYYWADSDVEEETRSSGVGTGSEGDAGRQQHFEYNNREDNSAEPQENVVTWRCECCRKNFGNEDMLKNHSKGRSHREARTKYMANQAEELEKKARAVQAQIDFDDDGIKRKGGKKRNLLPKFVIPESEILPNVGTMPTNAQNTDDTENDKINKYDEHADGDEIESTKMNGEMNGTEQQRIWRCEYCLKDFKSLGQMEHHTYGKKHHEAVRLYEAAQELKRAQELQVRLDAEALQLAEEIRNSALEQNYDYTGVSKRNEKRKGKLHSSECELNLQGSVEETSTEQKDEVDSLVTVDQPSTCDEQLDVNNEMSDDESGSEESEPTSWNCECCRKEFKSEGQMENHMNSKKHKDALKKYRAKQVKVAKMERNALLTELALHP